jgi:hypothetical protein
LSDAFPVVLALLAALLAAVPAQAYRPFVSTDADVAVYKTIELEMGYFGMSRAEGRTTYIEPQLVLNYGFLKGYEAVAEFQLNEPPVASPTASSKVVGSLSEGSVSVKHVWREGQLQDKPGPSFASETNLLLPGSIGVEQPRVGFLQAFMLSHRLGVMTFHWNLGAGVDQIASNAFATWGLIGELPLTKTLKAVGEINGQGERELTADNSGLVGLIWEPGWHDAAFDAGVRRGLAAVDPDYALTAGISIPFAVGRE